MLQIFSLCSRINLLPPGAGDSSSGRTGRKACQWLSALHEADLLAGPTSLPVKHMLHESAQNFSQNISLVQHSVCCDHY